jgi:hypothetical protein
MLRKLRWLGSRLVIEEVGMGDPRDPKKPDDEKKKEDEGEEEEDEEGTKA